MFPGNLKLFEIFGFEVKINLSWTVIALLIAWSLAQGYFPAIYKGLPTATYWWMGLSGVIGLFLSIVLHELAHSLVGRAFGIEIKSITLWMLGGVAELEGESPTPKGEFAMAIAGPLMSVFLAVIFSLFGMAAETAGAGEALIGVLNYLALLNMVLVVFNMVPAFPLDGGRVLRAILWGWTGDHRWATRLASRIGSLFGLGLMALGAMAVLFGPGITGIWWIIMGLFVRFAADSSLYQFEVNRILKGENLRRFTTLEPVTAPPDVTVMQFVDEWVYGHFHEFFPIVEDGELIGCAGVKQIKTIARGDWNSKKVRDIMEKRSSENTIDVQADAGKALELMRKTGHSRLCVIENGKLLGILTLKDMLRLIGLKMDLDDAHS